MTGIPSEHVRDVREALRLIVSDPGHGAQALSSPPVLSNLLKDLLPDAPREKNLLVAASEADLAGMMREHITQGIDSGSAIRLAAASFGANTHFTEEACTWVATELAVALGLAAELGESRTELPAEITTDKLPDDHSAAAPRATEVLVSGTALVPAPGSPAAPGTGSSVAGASSPAAAPDLSQAAGNTPAGRAGPANLGAILALAGAVAGLLAFLLPVFNEPYQGGIDFRLLDASSIGNAWWTVSGPTICLAIVAVCGTQLLLRRGKWLSQPTAAALLLASGIQLLVLFALLYRAEITQNGNHLRAGLPIGLAGALAILGSGIAVLRGKR